jgi:hypothetical protein
MPLFLFILILPVYTTYIHSISSPVLIAGQLSGKNLPGLALQQVDALPTELRRTLLVIIGVASCRMIAF